MSTYKFALPIEVRYGDLDPQGHVNNANYLTYLEQGRTTYLVQLGLWDGQDFKALGLIVADIHIAYLAPLLLWQKSHLEMRTARIGNKSLTFEYQFVDDGSAAVLAKAESVMVAYDYAAHASIPVPQNWREKIAAFEGTDPSEGSPK